MTDLDALTTLGSYAELWRRVQAAVLRWETGPAVSTIGSESEPSVIEDFGIVPKRGRTVNPLPEWGGGPEKHLSPAEAPEEPANSGVALDNARRQGSSPAPLGVPTRCHVEPADLPEAGTCDSCGKACPPGTLGPDPDPECAGLWCGECLGKAERARGEPW